MNKLIVITGDLAAGKSSLADSLSHTLNIPCFKKDTIKEHYCDLYGYKNREENRQLSIKAVNYMIDAFKQFAKQGQDLILEANFREEELLNIKDIAEENNYEVILLVLRGDIEKLYERFLARVPTRHIAHMSMGLNENIEKYRAYVMEQRKENLVFIPRVIKTTNKSEDEVLKIALEIVK